MVDQKKDKIYDVIVVGAGPGGSALSGLLAKKGLRVLLVDKNKVAGGRMMTVHHNGFAYELFPINGVPSRDSLFEQVTKELDIESEVEVIYPDPMGKFYFEHPNGEIRTMDLAMKNLSLRKLQNLLGLKFVDLFNIIKVFKDILTVKPEEQEKLCNVSAMDFLSRYHLPQSLSSYLLSMYCEGFYELPADRVPAAVLVRAFQQTFSQGGGRYYKGGIGTVFEAFVKATEKYGGTTMFMTRVEKILVEDGRVTGIRVKDTDYKAPIVISNAGIQPTILKLIGEQYFDTAYVNWVKNLELNLACVGYRWIINAPLLKIPMNVYLSPNSTTTLDTFRKMEQGIFPTLDHSYVYLGTTSLYPGCAPPGKQLVYACMSCLPDPALNVTPYLERVRAIVTKIQPDIFEHIEKEEIFGPASVPGVGRDAVLPGQGGESYGVALSVGQYGDPRLDGTSPIQGLFFVGCDAGGFGLGTHQAVDSAVNMTQIVLKYHQTLKYN